MNITKTLRLFEADMKNNNDYSKATIDSYLFTARRFLSVYKVLNNENAKLFILDLEKAGASPQTILNRLNGLIRFGKSINVAIVLKRPKITRKLSLENIVNIEEYNKLLEYFKMQNKWTMYFSVKLLGTTGVRVSELMQIKWNDLIQGEVYIKGKGGKYRVCFFTKELSQEAKKILKETSFENDFVVVNRYGNVMTARGFASEISRHATKIGINPKKTHPHAFRHFFAKMVLKKTKDVVQLADMLGHSSIDTTRIYLQKTYDEQKRDFNKCVTW